MVKSINIFCSCARKDYSLLSDLKVRLFPLQQNNAINWSDTANISAGIDRDQYIREHLNRAHIIILLISPDFFSSDSCSKEMQRAMERHEHREVRVIPVKIRATDMYDLPIAGLQAIPRNGESINHWQDKD